MGLKTRCEMRWDAGLLTGLCSNEVSSLKRVDIDAEGKTHKAKNQAWKEKTEEMFLGCLFNILLLKGTARGLPQTGGTCRMR